MKSSEHCGEKAPTKEPLCRHCHKPKGEHDKVKGVLFCRIALVEPEEKDDVSYFTVFEPEPEAKVI